MVWVNTLQKMTNTEFVSQLTAVKSRSVSLFTVSYWLIICCFVIFDFHSFFYTLFIWATFKNISGTTKPKEECPVIMDRQTPSGTKKWTANESKPSIADSQQKGITNRTAAWLNTSICRRGNQNRGGVSRQCPCVLRQRGWVRRITLMNRWRLYLLRLIIQWKKWWIVR